MNYSLIFSIARSLMIARWRQSLVATIGVTFSITMFISLLGFMEGLNTLLDGLILNRVPHVRLYNDTRPNKFQPVNAAPAYKNHYNFISSVKSVSGREKIYNSAAVVQALRHDKRVVGIAPKVTEQVFFNDGTLSINGLVNGIDAEEENRLFHFNEYMVRGAAVDIKHISNSIILGKPLAEKLLAEIGDMVTVITPEGDKFSFKVVGFYQSGIREVDQTQSFVSLSNAQKLKGETNNYITDLQVKLTNLNLAPAIALEYAKRFGTDAEDIQTAQTQFETGSAVRTLISYVVGIVLLIVAGFGIYNILNMMIYEKMDSIANLKATGFSGSDVRIVFLTIAVTIGIMGGMSGLLVGLLFSAGIDAIPYHPAAIPSVNTFPVNYNALFYIIGVIFALFTTFLAGWFPAAKASKADPVIIIRGK